MGSGSGGGNGPADLRATMSQGVGQVAVWPLWGLDPPPTRWNPRRGGGTTATAAGQGGGGAIEPGQVLRPDPDEWGRRKLSDNRAGGRRVGRRVTIT